MARIVGTTRNPEGRPVLLDERTWDHVVWRHPQMADFMSSVLLTVERPHHREPDPRPGRERYFGPGGPHEWLRVVTQFAGDIDRIVTAFPQSTDPTKPT